MERRERQRWPELRDDVHGGSVFHGSERGRGEELAKEVREEAEKLGRPLWRWSGRGDTRPARWGRSSRMAATHRARVVRWGVFANRWRATAGSAWDAILGCFQAESANGPKMKFDLLLMLSNFD